MSLCFAPLVLSVPLCRVLLLPHWIKGYAMIISAWWHMRISSKCSRQKYHWSIGSLEISEQFGFLQTQIVIVMKRPTSDAFWWQEDKHATTKTQQFAVALHAEMWKQSKFFFSSASTPASLAMSCFWVRSQLILSKHFNTNFIASRFRFYICYDCYASLFSNGRNMFKEERTKNSN